MFSWREEHLVRREDEDAPLVEPGPLSDWVLTLSSVDKRGQATGMSAQDKGGSGVASPTESSRFRHFLKRVH